MKPHRFSEGEAWLYLFSNLAQGIERNGVGRGEFCVSERFLAKRWMWSRAAVRRYLCKLAENRMIIEVAQQQAHLEAHKPAHFKICNYEAYQNISTTKRPTNRPTYRPKSNERVNERTNEIDIPRKPRGIKTEIPAGFEISQSMRTWAKEKAPWADIDAETPAFIDYHIAHASKHANWEAAWRNWMRNVKKFDRNSSKSESTSLTNTLWGKMK